MSFRTWIIGVAKEPLLHFFVAGACLALIAPREQGSNDAIVLSEQRWADLMRAEERSLTHAPTQEEQRALLERHLTEEIMYRESLRLGLADDDQAVRKRLVEKARAVARGAAEPPSDAALERYFNEHQERYSTVPRVKIDYVYFAIDRHDAGPSELALLKSQLDRDPTRSLEGLGEQANLARGRWSTHRELTQLLGATVADLAFAAPLHEWSGPVSSSYGSYLIRPAARETSRGASFAEAREHVQADWVLERGQARERSWLASASSRYRIALPSGLRWEPKP